MRTSILLTLLMALSSPPDRRIVDLTAGVANSPFTYNRTYGGAPTLAYDSPYKTPRPPELPLPIRITIMRLVTTPKDPIEFGGLEIVVENVGHGPIQLPIKASFGEPSDTEEFVVFGVRLAVDPKIDVGDVCAIGNRKEDDSFATVASGGSIVYRIPFIKRDIRNEFKRQHTTAFPVQVVATLTTIESKEGHLVAANNQTEMRSVNQVLITPDSL